MTSTSSKFNPMTSGRRAANVTKGGEIGKGRPQGKKGAGKQLGPSIGKGWLTSGKSNLRPTGGPFNKAASAGTKDGGKHADKKPSKKFKAGKKK